MKKSTLLLFFALLLSGCSIETNTSVTDLNVQSLTEAETLREGTFEALTYVDVYVTSTGMIDAVATCSGTKRLTGYSDPKEIPGEGTLYTITDNKIELTSKLFQYLKLENVHLIGNWIDGKYVLTHIKVLSVSDKYETTGEEVMTMQSDPECQNPKDCYNLYGEPGVLLYWECLSNRCVARPLF